MALFGNIVGFTGTQNGMTDHQKEEFRRLILRLNPIEFHHGDCIGADADAHIMVMLLFDLDCPIIIHPPSNPSKRANLSGGVLLPEKPYLARNRDIVDSSEILVATPATTEEQVRSGTWSTIRYAQRTGKKVHTIYPY